MQKNRVDVDLALEYKSIISLNDAQSFAYGIIVPMEKV